MGFATSAGEAGIIAAALILGFVLPVSPVQILWVNIITAVILGLALANEAPEAETMLRPRRPLSAGNLTGGLVWHVIFVTALFLAIMFGLYAYALDNAYPLPLAQTMSMNMLVVLEIFHLFYIRNIFGASVNWTAFKGIRPVWISIIVIRVAQFTVTYVPVVQPILGTHTVPSIDGALIIGIGVLFFAIIETEKYLGSF